MDENQIRIAGGRKQKFAALGDKEIFRLAKHKMEAERCYLDPYLTMESLAGELNVHRNALSRVVNLYAGVDFTTWMVSYRIAEVERLAAMKENQASTLEKLAKQAGFGSRASLYRGFKTIHGITPEEWRKREFCD